MSDVKVQEVFGQFAVEIDGAVSMYATEAEALSALSAFVNGAEHLAMATAYCDAQDFGDKNAKGKSNIIVDFLNWTAAQDAEEVAEEVEEEL